MYNYIIYLYSACLAFEIHIDIFEHFQPLYGENELSNSAIILSYFRVSMTLKSAKFHKSEGFKLCLWEGDGMGGDRQK